MKRSQRGAHTPLRWRALVGCAVLVGASCQVPRPGAAPEQAPTSTAGGTPSATTAPNAAAASPRAFGKLELRGGFRLQAASRVTATPQQLSTPGFAAEDWRSVTLPSTVLAGLLQSGVYPGPFVKNNLAQIPAKAFDEPYWYRADLEVPADFANHPAWLRLDGINYRAEVWLNGQQVASERDVVGAFTAHEWNVAELLRPGGKNALAVRVFPPHPKQELAIWWQDWNPAPPDQNMGIWQPISLERSGAVRVTNTHVLSHLELPSLARAELTLRSELTNTSTASQRVTLRAHFDDRSLSEVVTLAPGERRTVTLAAAQHPELTLSAPRLWWPRGMGEPNLYDLELNAELDGEISSQEHVQFGVRDVTFEPNAAGQRLFRVNGRPFFVRGGGWASDLLLRSSPERLEAELGLVRDLGLNTLRLEGKLETDAFYAAADRYGIALIPGWMCCDRWQESKSWTAAERAVARASTFDQARRLRNHPSVLSFMIGSDEAPVPEVERELVAELERADWQRPVSAAAADRTTPLLGKTGVKMSGPYDWVSPYYWYEDRAFGGAFGFNTETSPGPALPELETLRAWLPEADLEKLWSMPQAQQFHAGRNEFWDLKWFHGALRARHGKPENLEDFVRKAQLMNYEAERALFESYSGKRYRSATGIVHWLANSAWPSLIWHLYAHDLTTAAGYFGAKKANEPLHLQYDYAERSVSLVNETTASAEVTARTQVLDLSGAVRFEHSARVTVAADSVSPVVTLPSLSGLSSSYFVRLSTSRDGHPLSDNWYWLSTRPERSAYARSDFYHAPVLSYADLKGLGQLAPATITAKASFDGQRLRVTLDNASSGLAFFVRLSLTDGAGHPLAPVLWDDNYVSLAAGEQQEHFATLPDGSRWPSGATLRIAGFNVPAQDLALPPRNPQ